MSRDRSIEMFLIIRQHEAARDKARIGVCGLTNINWKDRHAEISIYIGDPEYEGRGVGTWTLGRLAWIAFMDYGLHRLWAEIYEFNGSSVLLFEKCGYLLEGQLGQTVWHNGAWCDSYIYGLLEQNWRYREAHREPG